MTQAYVQVGTDFNANTRPNGAQYITRIAPLSSGGFVLLWHDYDHESTTGQLIRVRLFNSNGDPLTGEILVDGPGFHNEGTVAGLASGGFVVSWIDHTDFSAGASIRSRVYDSSGNATSPELVVNTIEAGPQYDPEVVGLTGGGFVVTWTDSSLRAVGGREEIKAQLFSASGVKIGGEFVVNSASSFEQEFSDVAALPGGGFVVTWSDRSPQGATNGTTIKSQAFNADGTKLGVEVVVSDFAPNFYLRDPVVATLASGNYVVVYGAPEGANSVDVYAQIVTATGAKFGPAILVNTIVADAQWRPSITALPDGGFAVSWDDHSSGILYDANIALQVFDSTGAKVGGQLLVNSTTESAQQINQVAALASGQLVVSWSELGGAGPLGGVRVQMLAVPQTGTEGADTLTGTGANDALAGLGGDDMFNMQQGGNDSASGGFGNDTFSFGAAFTARDRIDGGAGNDVLLLAGDYSAGLTLGSFSLTSVETIRLAGGFDYRFTTADGNVANGGDVLIDGELLGAGDTIIFDATAETNGRWRVFAGAGDDTLIGGARDDALGGGAGNDLIIAGGGVGNSLSGGSGNDRIVTGIGYSIADGGADSDTLVVDFSAAAGAVQHSPDAAGHSGMLFDSVSNSVVYQGIEHFEITTGNFNDYIRTGGIIIGGGNDRIFLNGGDDFVDIGNGVDVADGGAGIDGVLAWMRDDSGVAIHWNLQTNTYSGLAGSSFTNFEYFTRLWTGLGDDVIVTGAIARNEQIYAGGGNDRITFVNGDEIFDGGDGFDTLVLDWSGALDRVYGGVSGTDFPGGFFGSFRDDQGRKVTFSTTEKFDITTGQYNDGVGGGDNDDVFHTGAGNDSISAYWGNDFLDGGAGNDFLYASAGNDTLDGGTGADEMRGETGDDLYFVDDGGDAVFEEAGWGTDTVRSSVSFVLGAEIENLILTGNAAIDGTGNASANLITGNAAANRLEGGVGADVLTGGLGNDVYVIDAGDQLVEAADGGSDEVRTTMASYMLAANFENLTGISSGDQTLTGNDLDNVINGAAGNDLLNGGLGSDLLGGGAGNDTYVVDQLDQISEAGGAGIDTVQAGFTYMLGANLERLTLTGTGAINGAGNGLDNVLTGNGAANLLDGGLGADTMSGGLGDDVYVVDNGGDTVVEAPGGGTDSVQSSATFTLAAEVENLTLTGLSAIDGTGNGLANIIAGNAGNNILNGAAGADAMTGGLGNDVYVVDNGGDTIVELAVEGTDEVRAALASFSIAVLANIENLTGTSNGGQTLTGNDGANAIVAGSGNDVIDGGLGADAMTGGLGDDLYFVDNGGDSATELGGQGSDEIRTALAAYGLGANFENLTGTSDAGQTLTGNDLANVIKGGWGNDVIDGGLGADDMRGSLGDDVYLVDNGGDTVTEGDFQGLDEVRTNLASFSIASFANVENLTGGAGDQNLTGNGWNNRIDGGAGADTMAGGGGHDVYVVDNLGDVVVEADGAGIDEIRTGLGSKAPPERAVYVLPNFVENLTGTSAGAQGVRDNALNNIINMGVGHDLVVADAGGIDTIDGGGGNDFIYYGDKLTAADITNGGSGTDTIGLIGNYASGITFTAANLIGVERMALYTSLYLPGTGPNNYNVTMVDANVVAGTEFFVTAASLQSNESLTFNGSAETDGRFTVHGGAGNDTITGGTGSDFFLGNAGNDALNGGGGNDFLYGGLGADQLTGGAGFDAFRYQSAAQSTAASMDHILDFTDLDRIDLSAIDADGNPGNGNQAFTFIGSNAFGSVAGQLRATESGGVWTVEGDVNGDGVAELVMQVTITDPTLPVLGASDFNL